MPMPFPFSEDHVVTLIVAVIASGGLSQIIAWGLHKIDSHTKPRKRDQAVEYGLQTLLYQKLQQIHSEMIRRGGWCPDEVKKTADRIYTAYHDLGGNGVGTSIWQDIMTSHSQPDHRHEKEDK